MNSVGLCGNWCCSIGLMSLLAMYRVGSDERYLQSAIRAANYLKTLQIVDPSHRHYGAFREHTPQTQWCFPRDTITTAWAMLCLHKVTGEKEWLRRSELLTNWYIKRARYTTGFAKGWIRWRVRLEGPPLPEVRMLGNFQAGAGVFLYNLHRATGKKRYLTQALVPLMSFYVDRFRREDGSFFGGYDLAKRSWHESDYGHRHNDDFAGLALLAAYKATRQKRFLSAAQAWAEFLLGAMTADGGFDDIRKTSAAAMSAIFLHELNKIAPRRSYIPAMRKLGRFLIDWQSELPNVKAYGGVYGEDDRKDYVSTRVTAYAIGAWLKLAGKADDLVYSVRGW
jgi:uncharacterized protein YyaL (SSP411 family)